MPRTDGRHKGKPEELFNDTSQRVSQVPEETPSEETDINGEGDDVPAEPPVRLREGGRNRQPGPDE